MDLKEFNNYMGKQFEVLTKMLCPKQTEKENKKDTENK